MSTHTPELWEVEEEQGFGQIYADGRSERVVDGYDGRLLIQDARRIVECVNALAGIPDPAAFVAAVKELADNVTEGNFIRTLVCAGRLAAMLKGDSNV